MRLHLNGNKPTRQIVKTVNWAIIAASIFISLVMGYLMWSGVHLKERRMVKWSSIEAPEEAGKKIALFLYPLIAEFEEVVVYGDDPFTGEFLAAFQETENRTNRGNKVRRGPAHETDKTFSIHILEVDNNFVSGCKQGKKSSCIAIKAKKKLDKKPRDPGKIWFSMYRTSKSQALLFYRKSRH